MNLSCPHCRTTLPSADATATHCRHCRAPLPHGDAAAQHQAMMRDFMARQPASGAPQPTAIAYGGGHLGAMIGKSVQQSMSMSLWITLAGVGVTFLITAALIVTMLLR